MLNFCLSCFRMSVRPNVDLSLSCLSFSFLCRKNSQQTNNQIGKYKLLTSCSHKTSHLIAFFIYFIQEDICYSCSFFVIFFRVCKGILGVHFFSIWIMVLKTWVEQVGWFRVDKSFSLDDSYRLRIKFRMISEKLCEWDECHFMELLLNNLQQKSCHY